VSFAQDKSRARSSNHLGEMVILFVAGGVKFAIAADAVDEVRELGGLKEFSAGISHPKLEKVRHTLDRQGHRYFVLDACAHFGTRSRRPTRLMVLRHARAAVMVDSVDRMQEIQFIRPLPDAFSGKERDWYRGLTVLKGRVVPVVKPEAFLSKVDVALLDAAKYEREKGIAVTA
jgi:chemotaxis signal transduction protein